MSVRMVEDPIINNLLSRLKRTVVTKEEVLSRESDGEEDNLSSGSGDEPLTEETDYTFYPGGGGFDYDYLDSLLSAEINNDDAEKEDSDEPKTVYRDFPVDEGYVRIPVQYPGLTLTKIQAPPPKLWTAEESFKTRVLANILYKYSKLFSNKYCISGGTDPVYVHTSSAAWFHHRYGDMDHHPERPQSVFHLEKNDGDKDSRCGGGRRRYW